MLHMIIEVTIMMFVAYVFGWGLGVNFRTLGDDSLRQAVKAASQSPGDDTSSGG